MPDGFHRPVFLFYILAEVLRHGLSGINSDLFTKDSAPPMLEDVKGGLRQVLSASLC